MSELPVNQIITGDCLEVMRDWPDRCLDLVVTDPPYGISIVGGYFRRINRKGTRRYDFFPGDEHGISLRLVKASLHECHRLSRATGSIYVFCGHRQFGPIDSLLRSHQWKTRFLVWEKPYPAPALPGRGWPSAAELCIYGYGARRTWNPLPGEPPYSNVLSYDSYRNGVPGKVNHPTQKPLALIIELIRYSSNPCDIVLDPFCGSGTTCVAAKKLNRRYIGIEINPGYAEIARTRLKAVETGVPVDDIRKGQMALFQ